ncbi:hypothetical protein GGR56DRAFT_637996, partial [Xylariaceae sp. FL0804]
MTRVRASAGWIGRELGSTFSRSHTGSHPPPWLFKTPSRPESCNLASDYTNNTPGPCWMLVDHPVAGAPSRVTFLPPMRMAGCPGSNLPSIESVVAVARGTQRYFSSPSGPQSDTAATMRRRERGRESERNRVRDSPRRAWLAVTAATLSHKSCPINLPSCPRARPGVASGGRPFCGLLSVASKSPPTKPIRDPCISTPTHFFLHVPLTLPLTLTLTTNPNPSGIKKE